MESTHQAVGNIFTSLQYLPRWYQVLGLAGIILLVYFRQNDMVEWLLTSLHVSVGTQYLWYEEYQEPLELMRFLERLGFTFYGVALSAIAFFLGRYFILRCDSFGGGELFPEHSGKNYFCIALFFVLETVSLRNIICSCFSDPDSSASAALRGLQSDFSAPHTSDESFPGFFAVEEVVENNPLDPFSSCFTQHFIIQRSILFRIVNRFLFINLPVLVITFFYRAVRDARRKIFVSLRWYMATYMTFFCLIQLVFAMFTGEWGGQTLWVSFCCCGLYIGLVNYSFGTAKRAGRIAHTSYIRCLTLAALGTGMCMLIWSVCLLVALAIGVSMHVFELIVIWMSIFLIFIWIPAAIDSFATSYMVVLTAVSAYIGYRMQAIESLAGVARYMLLGCAGWINLSLQYHLWLNVFFSRYLSCGIVIGLLSVLVLYFPSSESEVSTWFSVAMEERAKITSSPFLELYLSLWIGWWMNLCNVSPTLVVSLEFLPTRLSAYYLGMTGNPVLCTYIVCVMGQICMSAVTLGTLVVYHKSRHSIMRTKKMRSLNIHPITPLIFLVQLTRGVTTLIVVLIFVTSYTVVKDTFLPNISVAAALPSTVQKTVALFVTCAFIGFLDCGEVINTSILRALGLREPPAPDALDHSDGVE